MKRTFLLENLDCANCAAKLELAVKGLADVKSCSVNFMALKLVLEADESKMDGVVKSAERLIKETEPEINMRDSAPETAKKERAGYRLLRIIIGGIVFAACLIMFEAVKLDIPWLGLTLYIAAFLIIGIDVLYKAGRNLLRGKLFDENFLMALAAAGAFTLAAFPNTEPAYSEGVAVMLFYQVGELFQDYAVAKSRRSITALMDIRPDYANLIRDGQTVRVNPDLVRVGDLIAVGPGEKIPLDGRVAEGGSTLDTAALTGESVPRGVSAGDEVLSGCLNINGLLIIEVTKEFGESAVSKILDLVENASSRKSRPETFITKFAKVYTPIVVAAAALLAVLPPLFLGDFGGLFPGWLKIALTFLVVSCPCALVISIPMSFFGGIGGASAKGILVKGSNHLESLSKAEIVVFDKTGTLTKGVFKVRQINAEGVTAEELLYFTAHAENYSSHPISLSLKEAYAKEIDTARISDVEEISGLGVTAYVDGKKIAAGNVKLMKKIGAEYSRDEIAGTAVHAAIDGKYAGYILIADEIKDDSYKAMSALEALGIKQTVMLTGDSQAAGREVADALGIGEVYAGLLPADKVERVERLLAEKSPKGKLIFVGDGINDAPVLARADIGIAMGGLGSDAAVEAADVVLMTDEPSKIAAAIRISRKTLGIAMQNIVFAIAIKAAVLILTPLGLTNMWIAVFADVGVAVLAILNAFRALKIKG
jgi:Cd2+/Zn2+-exporting ATPase